MSNQTFVPEVGTYVLAELVGFQATQIRCRVERVEVESDNVWIRTADLLDAGTPLTVSLSKVSPADEPMPMAMIHSAGLVFFDV